MLRTFGVLAALLPLALSAQGPTRQPGVEFLLARTGTLQLTDQQVVKLAAIARRAADRHKAMHASFDSLRMQMRRGGDSTAREHRRGGPPPQLMAAMKQEHDAAHADLRDALAVLNPDQQAHAWELISQRRMMHRHGFGPRRGGGPQQHFRAGPQGPMHRQGAMMSDPGGDEDEAALVPPTDDSDVSDR
jgi:LTXXQ motif family protein